MTNTNELDANALLQAAAQAGVTVTVDCQCPGIFVNGKQIDGGRYRKGAPADVAPDLLAALTAHVDELKPLLEASGAWSCGCELGKGTNDAETQAAVYGIQLYDALRVLEILSTRLGMTNREIEDFLFAEAPSLIALWEEFREQQRGNEVA
jgi:hypothetical protein